jgi:EmrB/QacA subfamily drug resistance transporter
MRTKIFAPETRKWFTLAAVAFGLFMIMLDNTVVNVALPSIQRDLKTDLSELEWIVTGYALTFAALMLIGGKVADAYGRRLIFVVGIAVFTLASLWCGLASSGNELITARVVQGIGAALMNPATLSIIAATFPPRERGTAIGIWAGVSALALAIGPLAGGLITEHLNWSWIFFVNVPVGALGIVASFVFIDESRDETHQRLDIPGLAASGIGLFSLTYALIEANTYGWGSPRIVGAFAVAAVALGVFVLLERYQRAPMLPLDLFRNRTYTGANTVILLVALAMFGVFFFVSLYMQNILGYSAVQAGAAFLPMTLLVFGTVQVVPRFIARVGNTRLLGGGLVVGLGGMMWLSQLGEGTRYFPQIAIPLLLLGVGMGTALTPLTSAGIAGVAPDDAGAASGLVNTAHQLGGALGISVLVTVFTAAGGGENAHELADGVAGALIGSVVFLALALLVVVAVIGRPARSPAAAAEVARG